MKQFIDKKQFEELNKKHQYYLLNKLFNFNLKLFHPNIDKEDIKYDVDYCVSRINIGEIINFLGDDWYFRIFEFDDGTSTNIISYLNSRADGKYKELEFLDVLWEAVKYKINNIKLYERKNN